MKIQEFRKIMLFAFIVGIIYVLPNILFIWEEGKNYHLYFKTHGEALIYASRVREVYDGNYLNSDSCIYENKNKPYIRPFLSEYLVGSLGKILGLSIDNLFILGNFIFPIIIFFLFFYFIKLLVDSVSLSLLGATAILIAELPDSLTNLVRLRFPEWFLSLSHPISPQFHYIFFVTCLIFIYKSLANNKIINILLAGLFLGLLFFMYPYFWICIFVSLGLLSLYLILKKEYRQIRIIFFILIEALLISIPFWINYLKLMHLPFYYEIMSRVMLQKSHHVVISKLSILILFIFITFYKRRDFNFFFILSFLFSVLLCMTQQVITGWTFEPDHWHLFVNKQMAVVAGIALLKRYLEGKRFREKFIRFFLIIGLTFSISIGILIQFYNYEKNKPAQQAQQHLYEAFLWLENNTEKEDVVLASDTVSLLIPIHTHNNIYWSSDIFEYANSDKDILERFFLLARLFGMDDEEVINYILVHREKGHSDFFGTRYEAPSYKKRYNQAYKHAKVELPQHLYDYIKQRYRAFREEDINISLRRFRADYFFYSEYERLISKGRFRVASFLDKVYDSGGIQIYKIIR